MIRFLISMLTLQVCFQLGRSLLLDSGDIFINLITIFKVLMNILSFFILRYIVKEKFVGFPRIPL